MDHVDGSLRWDAREGYLSGDGWGKYFPFAWVFYSGTQASIGQEIGTMSLCAGILYVELVPGYGG